MVVLVLGLFTLLIGGVGATIFRAHFLRVAAVEEQPRTAASLAAERLESFGVARVEVTPEVTAPIRIRGKDYTIFTVAEADDVVFLTLGEPPSPPASVVVENESSVVIPGCEFRTEFMGPRTRTYLLNDPRPAARRDARQAGRTAMLGWPTGIALSLIGLGLLRSQPRVPPAPPLTCVGPS